MYHPHVLVRKCRSARFASASVATIVDPGAWWRLSGMFMGLFKKSDVIQNRNVNVGVYTNYNNWAAIVGGSWTGAQDLPLWWADWNGHQVC